MNPMRHERTPGTAAPPRTRRRRRNLVAVSVGIAGAALCSVLVATGEPGGVRAQASGSYVPVATWRSATTPLQADAWRGASGLDVAADGRVFVADAEEARVTIIDLDESVSVWTAPDGSALPFVEPAHLAIDRAAARVFVADPGAGVVHVLGLNGADQRTFAVLSGVVGVAVAPDGSVIAVSADTGEVVRFDAAGVRLGSWQAVPHDPNGELLRAVDVDADGLVHVLLGREPRDRIFQADGSLAQDLRIVPPGAPVAVFDLALDYDPLVSPDKRAWFATTRGLVSYEWRGTQWEVNPLAGDLAAVAIDRPRGKVYGATVGASPFGGRVLRLRYSGADTDAPERTWQSSILRLGEFDGPENISIGADGLAYVLDHGPRVQRFGTDGAVRGQLDQLNPTAVTAAPNNAAYVTDGGRIVAFAADAAWIVPRPEPVWTVDIATNFGDANAVALGFDVVRDQVVVLDALAGRLWRFAAGGARATDTRLRAQDGTTAVWVDLDVDPDGTAYVLDRGAGRVVVVSPGGDLTTVPLRDGARAIAASSSDAILTLARDGWVRRYDGAGELTAAFDATRFDVAPASSPSDVAVDTAGNVYVSDRDAGLLTVFRWDAAAPAVEPPGPGAQCRNFPAKHASPGSIDLGDTVEVRLGVRGGCGSETSSEPRDILLVLDRSESMQGERIGVLKGAALNFVSELDLATARVGVVSFNDEARLETGLTDDIGRIRNAISRLDPDGQTRIDLGIAEARHELGRRGRSEAKPIFIVFSDGSSDYAPAKAESDLAKERSVEIYAVGIQAWARLMREIATDDAHYFAADSARFLYGIFERLSDRIGATALFRTLVVTDEIPANMQYVEGSAAPPATWDPAARTLVWSLTDVPFNGFSIRYRLEPLAEGLWPTNVAAWGDFVDGFNQLGRVDFPVPSVLVGDVGPPPTPSATATVAPSATPTVAPSATPSPTASRPSTGPPVPIHLPVALREEKCVPGQKHADVVLVIDASSSMAGAKLAAAKGAAKQFIASIQLPDDYVAVVAFHLEASLESRLVNDARLLNAAVDGIEYQPGTRIDLGLHAALDELASPRHDPARTAVVVLLTDGRQDDVESVRSAARRATEADVQLFAIGLGDDVDAGLLRSIAGAGATYLAPSPADLAQIYARIAVLVPCPPSRYWGRR